MDSEVVIPLYGIRALSRNRLAKHWTVYKRTIDAAIKQMEIQGRSKMVHFTHQVDVTVQAYIDVVNPQEQFDSKGKPIPEVKNGKLGVKKRRMPIIDTPNIDDKIFTDLLIRWRLRQITGTTKKLRLENTVWFIEDDSPKHLRRVIKEAIAADENKVVLTITPVTT